MAACTALVRGIMTPKMRTGDAGDKRCVDTDQHIIYASKYSHYTSIQHCSMSVVLLDRFPIEGAIIVRFAHSRRGWLKFYFSII